MFLSEKAIGGWKSTKNEWDRLIEWENKRGKVDLLK